MTRQKAPRPICSVQGNPHRRHGEGVDSEGWRRGDARAPIATYFSDCKTQWTCFQLDKGREIQIIGILHLRPPAVILTALVSTQHWKSTPKKDTDTVIIVYNSLLAMVIIIKRTENDVEKTEARLLSSFSLSLPSTGILCFCVVWDITHSTKDITNH